MARFSFSTIRRELSTQGWSLVDTSKLFDRDFKVKPCNDRVSFHNETIFHEKLSDFLYNVSILCLSEFMDDPRKFGLHLDARYIGLGGRQEYTHWHSDGRYVRSITRITGASTEFKAREDSEKVLTIPFFWTLLMTARDRSPQTMIPCTYHRAPSPVVADRSLIVGTMAIGEFDSLEEVKLIRAKIAAAVL